MSNLKLSIIIPAFNEEKIVDKLLNDIDKAFSDVEDYEIIMIDDGSNLSLIEYFV